MHGMACHPPVCGRDGGKLGAHLRLKLSAQPARVAEKLMCGRMHVSRRRLAPACKLSIDRPPTDTAATRSSERWLLEDSPSTRDPLKEEGRKYERAVSFMFQGYEAAFFWRVFAAWCHRRRRAHITEPPSPPHPSPLRPCRCPPSPLTAGPPIAAPLGTFAT